jgi:hypothetical protein
MWWHIPLKHQLTSTRLHSIISQKIEFIIITTVRTSNPAAFVLFICCLVSHLKLFYPKIFWVRNCTGDWFFSYISFCICLILIFFVQLVIVWVNYNETEPYYKGIPVKLYQLRMEQRNLGIAGLHNIQCCHSQWIWIIIIGWPMFDSWQCKIFLLSTASRLSLEPTQPPT